MQKQRGITLVSLVLTIILMLILAGLTINVVSSNNGLLNKKNKAVNEYYSEEKNITDKIKTVENEWSGVIK